MYCLSNGICGILRNWIISRCKKMSPLNWHNYSAHCCMLFNKVYPCYKGLRSLTEIIVFHARLSTDQKNIKDKAAVVFVQVTLNTGNAYSATTSELTSPVKRHYSFTYCKVLYILTHWIYLIVFNSICYPFHVSLILYLTYDPLKIDCVRYTWNSTSNI